MRIDPRALAADDRRGTTFAVALIWLVVAVVFVRGAKLAFS